MILSKTTRTFILSLALAGVSFADLPQDLEKVTSSTDGNLDGGALRAIEKQVAESFGEKRQRAATEQSLLAALDSAKSPQAKIFICHQLFFVASPASIAKLEPLLADEQVSHAARYTIAKLESPDAAAAVHRALAKTAGKTQAGLLNTLGRLRHAPAAMDVGKLALSTDPVVARSAIAALGQIADDAAFLALKQVRDSVSPDLRRRVDDAMLEVADRTAAGNGFTAAGIYEALYAPDRPRPVRIAALRGLVALRGEAATPRLADAIKGDDAELAAAAISFTPQVRGEALSKLLTDLFKTASPAQQEQLVRAVAARGDATARAAVVAALQDDDARVRVAALESLGDIGDASSVELLAPALAKGDDERNAARVSLLRLKGDGVDDSIRRSMADDARVRAELVRALVGRKSATTQELLRETTHAEGAVRREAIAGLGALGREADVPSLVALAIKPKDPGDRTAIEDATAAVLRRLNDPAKASALINDQLATASPDATPAVLRLLRGAPTQQSLDAVRARLDGADKPTQEAAIRTLADWPGPAAAKDLERLARSAPTPPLKILALRGYVRLADQSPEPLPMYTRAMELAERPDERRLVLGGLAKVESPAALKLALNVLDTDATLTTEAGNAVNQIAERLRGRDAAEARAALQAVVEKVKDPRVRQKAQDVLKQLEERSRRRP